MTKNEILALVSAYRTTSFQELIMPVEAGLQNGKDFIVLRHKKPNVAIETLSGVDELKARMVHNPEVGSDVAVIEERPGCAYFLPEPRTRIRYCFLLDTEHNRQLIVSHFLEQVWEVMDADINAWAETEAKKLKVKRDPNLRKSAYEMSVITPSQVMQGLSADQLAEKRERLQQEMENLEKAMKQKIEDEPTERMEKDLLQPDTRTPPDDMSFAKAKELVHSQQMPLIEELRKKHKNFWLTDVYKQKVLPLITALMQPPAEEKPEEEEATMAST